MQGEHIWHWPTGHPPQLVVGPTHPRGFLVVTLLSITSIGHYFRKRKTTKGPKQPVTWVAFINTGNVRQSEKENFVKRNVSDHRS